MVCSKKTLNKAMNRIRLKHHNYGLKRRKKIARTSIYRKKIK